MSEDVTRDPLVARLARFTPSAAAIDRDALLLAVGRASAPGARAWKLATAVLALAQAATLGVWLAGPGPGPPPVAPGRAGEPPPEAPGPRPPSPVEPPSPASYGELVRRWQHDGLPPPSPVADPAPARPPLSVAAGRRPDDLP